MKRLALLCLLALALPARAFNIIWDFTLDTDGFWTAERREVLTLVEQQFEHWTINTANWQDYWDGGPVELSYEVWNLVTHQAHYLAANPQANTLTVFLGSGDLGLGIMGLSAMSEVVVNNDQPHPLDDFFGQFDSETTYQAFAGVLFINSADSHYDGLNPDVPPGEYDLFTTVMHEMGHILGIGQSQQWINQREEGVFKGPHTLAITGGTGAPMNEDGHHLLNPSLLMDEYLKPGVRRTFSELEYAIYRDLGYTIIPEPNAAWLVLGGAALLCRRRRNAPR